MSHHSGDVLKRSFAILAIAGLAVAGFSGFSFAAGGGSAPTFTNPENQLVFEGDTLYYELDASDPDADALSFFTLASPPGLVVTQTDADTLNLTWTPTNLQSDDWEATFRVSDGTLFTETTIEIRVSDVEDAPVFVPVSDRSVANGDLVRFYVAAVDPDGDALSYSTSEIPAGATFDASTRMFTWVPGPSVRGPHNVTFVASDGTLVGEETVVISLPEPNRAPVAKAIANLTVIQARNVGFKVAFTDPDADNLTLTVETAPTTGTYTFNATSGAFTWNTTCLTPVGVHTLAFNANDTELNTTLLVNVNVLANLAPVVNITGPAVVQSDETGEFGISATDPEGRPVAAASWQILNASNVVVANGVGNAVTFTPSELGNHTLNATAVDPEGCGATTSSHAFVVDDIVQVSLTLIRESVNVITSNVAIAKATSWDGLPIANQTIEVVVTNLETEQVWTFTTMTRADGTIAFAVPRDEGNLLNRPGEHVVTISTVLPTSFGGDAETASATAAYDVTLL